MQMQAIQDLLTLAIEATAIIGFGAIALQDILRQHRRFMREFCPPVAPYMPQVAQLSAEATPTDEELAQRIDELTHGEESVPSELISEVVREIIQELKEVTETAPDPWTLEVDEQVSSQSRLATRHFSPQPALPPAAASPAPTLDLDAMNAHQLRSLCSRFGVAWRNARGKHRHMGADTMRFQLRQVLAAA